MWFIKIVTCVSALRCSFAMIPNRRRLREELGMTLSRQVKAAAFGAAGALVRLRIQSDEGGNEIVTANNLVSYEHTIIPAVAAASAVFSGRL